MAEAVSKVQRMPETLKFLLKRSVVLYLAIGIVFTIAVDHNKAAQQRSRYLLGVFYNESLSNYQDGIVYFDFLSKLRPKDGKNYFFLGYCYLYLGQYDNALAYFERALFYMPDEALYQQYLAHVKSKINKDEKELPLPAGTLPIPLE